VRVHVVIDETGFFLPEYLDYVARHLPDEVEITGVSILHHGRGSPTLYSHVKANWWRIGLGSCARLGLRVLGQRVRCLFHALGVDVQPGSVERTCRRLELRHHRTTDVNSVEELAWISETRPDLILSSCSQIFRGPLLALPQIGAINRHSALLPSYGGLFPIFQAVVHEEKWIGSSVHVMTDEIDKGGLVTQSAFEVEPGMTLFDCYERSYEDCGPLTIQAFQKIRSLEESEVVATDFGVRNDRTPSYFTFPTAEDWAKFRRLRMRFC
jgi:methionyl-tRNA formyltransferase